MKTIHLAELLQLLELLLFLKKILINSISSSNSLFVKRK